MESDMADQPQQPSVPFQTRGGHTVNIQQPQRGLPANRVPPPSAHSQPQVNPEPAVPPGEDGEGRMVVRWNPLRSDGVDRVVLTDCVFDGLPPSPAQEQDLTSRMVLGLLTETLALRARLETIEGVLKAKGIDVTADA